MDTPEAVVDKAPARSSKNFCEEIVKGAPGM